VHDVTRRGGKRRIVGGRDAIQDVCDEIKNSLGSLFVRGVSA
jgi:hypothetical protein